MGFVLNEIEIGKEPNCRHLWCRLADGVTIEARIFAPDALLSHVVPRTASFLPMAYLAAATRGQSLEVNCRISEAEWNAFLFGFMPLVTYFYDLPQVKVSKSALLKADRPEAASTPQSALLFSGGVDSFYSLLKLKEARRGPDFLVNISAGAYPNKQEWMAAFANLDQIATKTGLPVIFIDTNFHGLFEKPHLASHTIRNISAASLLSGLVSTVFYSSSESFRELNYQKGKNEGIMSLVEPSVLLAMQRPDIGVVVLGSEVERIEKTGYIMSNGTVQSHLDVCTNARYQVTRGARPLNCGACLKCIRTMFTLDAFDALDQFAACFPVADFRLHRAELFKRLKAATLTLDRDVVDFWRAAKGQME